MGDEDKGFPIPIRFDPSDEEMIDDLVRRTGLNRSEVIRRCVRYTGIAIADEGARILYELPPTEYALKRKQPAKKKKL